MAMKMMMTTRRSLGTYDRVDGLDDHDNGHRGE